MSDAAQARKIEPFLKDWGTVAGRHLLLPELRGFWPFSTINESGNAIDGAIQGRTLTNNNTTPRAIYGNLINYYDFNGSTQYLSRADEAGLSVTGALTLGGWFWLDTIASTQTLIGKYVAGGNQSYFLQYQTGNGVRAGVSGNGTADVTVTGTNLTASSWNHCVLSYTPSGAVSVTVNGEITTNTTSIPASIFDSTAQLTIGSLNGASQFLDGRAALCFIAADDFPLQLIQELYLVAAPFFR